MNENHDAETGQFASGEPLFGREALERDAGWTPLKDEKDENDGLSVKDAAEELTEARAEDPEIRVIETGLPEDVSLTVEQAAESLIAATAADQEKQLDELRAEQIRKEVDDIRGADAEAKEIDKPEVKAEAAAPEVELERFLQNPHVKETFEKFASEVEAVKSGYSQALDTANALARQSFADKFPEIANLPLEHWEGALVAIAQREPERFKQAFASLSQINDLTIAKQRQQQLAEIEQQTKLQQQISDLDAKFEEQIKDVPPEKRKAIEGHIVDAIKQMGAPQDQMIEVMNLARSHPFARQMIWQWGEAMEHLGRIRSSVPKAMPRPVPKVQRPGTAGAARSAAAEVSLKGLEARLSNSGDIKDAVRLYQARQQARS